MSCATTCACAGVIERRRQPEHNADRREQSWQRSVHCSSKRAERCGEAAHHGAGLRTIVAIVALDVALSAVATKPPTCPPATGAPESVSSQD